MAIKNVRTGEIIDDEERGLTVYRAPGGGMLMPLASSLEAAAAIAAYEELKSAIVRPDDIQIIQGRNFLKKSFWRRVAACFGLSLEMVGEERLLLDGKLAYRATYRAIAPNGRTMDGDGMCMQGEKGQMIEHNIRAIAHTRAKNRAISDIVGGGEVSAEEMPDDDGVAPAPARPQQQRPQAPRPAPKPAPKTAPQTPAPWKALTDPDVLAHLHALEITGRESEQAFLATVRDELAAVEAPWTHDQVLAHLRENYPLPSTDGADLADLDTGAPGN